MLKIEDGLIEIDGEFDELTDEYVELTLSFMDLLLSENPNASMLEVIGLIGALTSEAIIEFTEDDDADEISVPKDIMQQAISMARKPKEKHHKKKKGGNNNGERKDRNRNNSK